MSRRSLCCWDSAVDDIVFQLDVYLRKLEFFGLSGVGSSDLFFGCRKGLSKFLFFFRSSCSEFFEQVTELPFFPEVGVENGLEGGGIGCCLDIVDSLLDVDHDSISRLKYGWRIGFWGDFARKVPFFVS